MPTRRTRSSGNPRSQFQRLVPSLLVLGLASLASGQGPAQAANHADQRAGGHAAVFPNGAVAADHAIASEAGAEILRSGGNAVDAAVATSFTLSVVRPYSCGIGGGGFMVIRLTDDPRHGKVTAALNYREKAPIAVHPDFFDRHPAPDASTRGATAVAVPGTVAGLLLALDRFGTLPREKVLAPAIAAATDGFTVDDHYIVSTRELITWFRGDPRRQARFRFTWERFLAQGEIKVGDVIKLPEQAEALRLIAAAGKQAFYQGPIAEAMLKTSAADRGVLSRADLAFYAEDGVKLVEPLAITFRGHTALTMPPPSSGGVVLAQVFGMFDRRADLLTPAIAAGPESASYIHLLTEASKHAFADRARWLADPDVLPADRSLPIRALVSGAYLEGRARSIDATRTFEPDFYGTTARPPDDGGTSHLSVVDRWGGAVACTETINLIFGSLLVVPEFGFALNNQMDDFQARADKPNAFGLIQAADNRPSPGKRPLSSMTPLIVVKQAAPDEHANERADEHANQHVVLVAGASGGPRIISGTLQAALRVLLFDASADDAVSKPRFHHQWKPDRLELEPALMGGETERALREIGHATAATSAASPVGNVQLIRSSREREADGWEAASDPRKGGRPAGY